MTDFPRAGWTRDPAHERQFRDRLQEAAEIWRARDGDRHWTVVSRTGGVFVTLTLGEGLPEPFDAATADMMLAAARGSAG